MMTRLDKLEASLAFIFTKMEATVAKIKASLVKMEANITKALQAWPGIAPSVQILLSPTTMVSLPTAAGSADIVATAKLRIKEVCAGQDAHLEMSMVDFWSFAAGLNHCQTSMPVSFALLNDNEDDEDEGIHIVLSTNNADNKIKDIAVVLASPPPLPYAGAVVPFLGGNICCQLTSCCWLLS